MPNKWDFKVRRFAGAKHFSVINEAITRGVLVGETDHKGEASAAVDIEVCQDRIRRGEIERVELIDLRPGGTLTNLAVDASTKIPWSWASIERLRQAT